MLSKPFISVIVPTYHDWERLQLCLNALEQQTYPKDRFEIIVVNNDLDNQPPEDFIVPDICVLTEEEKPGSYAARNKGISLAKGEVFAFTDSDCQPQRDWVEKSVDLLCSSPEIERIGGKISLIMSGREPTIAEIYEKVYAFRQRDFVRDKGMAATGNMIAKKKVFERVGMFNDDLMSGGDAEWGMRAQSQGAKIVYSGECIVWHPTRSKLSELVQKTKREAGGHYVLLKNRSKIRLVLQVFMGFLPPLKSIFRVSIDPDLSSKEKVIAISIRYYLRMLAVVEKLFLIFAWKNVERK